MQSARETSIPGQEGSPCPINWLCIQSPHQSAQLVPWWGSNDPVILFVQPTLFAFNTQRNAFDILLDLALMYRGFCCGEWHLGKHCWVSTLPWTLFFKADRFPLSCKSRIAVSIVGGFVLLQMCSVFILHLRFQPPSVSIKVSAFSNTIQY